MSNLKEIRDKYKDDIVDCHMALIRLVDRYEKCKYKLNMYEICYIYDLDVCCVRGDCQTPNKIYRINTYEKLRSNHFNMCDNCIERLKIKN